MEVDGAGLRAGRELVIRTSGDFISYFYHKFLCFCPLISRLGKTSKFVIAGYSLNAEYV